jgi:hypothetical protein
MLFSQDLKPSPRTDVIYLKNGSVFRGQIEAYEVGKTLKLRIDKDNLLVFESDQIKKVVQLAMEHEATTAAPKKKYAFKEKGIYFAAQLGYIGGNDQFGNYVNGFNIHIKSGYQFHRLLGAGIGTGVDFYNVNIGTIVPVYGEVRGYLSERNISPFYTLAAGVGVPIRDQNSAFNDGEMGIYLAPSVGLRLGASSEANMTISLGLQWQKATYTQNIEGNRVFNEDEYTFRRFNLGVGLIF